MKEIIIRCQIPKCKQNWDGRGLWINGLWMCNYHWEKRCDAK